MGRAEQFVLCLFATALVAGTCWKSRVTSHHGAGNAVFLRYTATKVLVRVAGDVARPGVYQIPDGTRVGDVINMTVGKGRAIGLCGDLSGRPAVNGDIFMVKADGGKPVEITLGKMGARERMLFGIPLEVDAMSRSDWESLPGIGPKLAEAIEMYRQKYGAFGSIDRLKRVPGFGEKRFQDVRSFFRQI